MNTPPSLARTLPVRYCGRDFTPQEIEEIRRIIAAPENPTRAAIGRAVCQAFHWLKPDGGLKAMSCSVVLRRMEADGLLALPPSRGLCRAVRGLHLGPCMRRRRCRVFRSLPPPPTPARS